MDFSPEPCAKSQSTDESLRTESPWEPKGSSMAERRARTKHLQPLKDRIALAIRGFHRATTRRRRIACERILDRLRPELQAAMMKADELAGRGG